MHQGPTDRVTYAPSFQHPTAQFGGTQVVPIGGPQRATRVDVQMSNVFERSPLNQSPRHATNKQNMASQGPAQQPRRRKTKQKNVVEGLDDDPSSRLRKSTRTVQLRKTIYSAAAIRTLYWPTAVVTFAFQMLVMILHFHGDSFGWTGTPFAEIGYDVSTEEEKVLLALARFVSYTLTLTFALRDLQNAVNLVLCTKGCDKILGVFQMIVVFTAPLAWVAANRTSVSFLAGLKNSGILIMFLKLDEALCSLLGLGVLKREIGAVVYTISNPQAPKVRELVMNLTIISYTVFVFIYAWWAAFSFYWPILILWLVTTSMFFAAFWNDATDDDGAINEMIRTMTGSERSMSGFESSDGSDEICCGCCYQGEADSRA